MADSWSLPKRSVNMDISLGSELNEILKNSKSISGPTTKYILTPTVLTDGDLLRKERIGPQNEGKPNKVILMLGETGTGKSTLINAMINYIMGIRWEHKLWLEVTEIPEDQTQSQTKVVTVYEVSAQSSPFLLTVIDTPGFGDTEGFDKDRRVSEALQQLFRSDDGIHEIHAICIVLNATDVRLHERKRYILDEILSLFGKDIDKHILLLLTHQEKQKLPKKILNYCKESFVKYVKNNEHVCFLV
ncbi:GTPase IMAP family member 4-like [Danio aesculapii]|uniref:GTPase IMAP family member 4-like n=1 Tax=Danio aesculapii TaxID=1142201 RepID=UPI0024BFBDF3|nr:GTPase IMAP family member 4-like [Danio aesculapii]